MSEAGRARSGPKLVAGALLALVFAGIGLLATGAGSQAVDAARSDCWPQRTPVGALAGQPAPVFCAIDNEGPGTAVSGPNSWVDDFDHGLSFASLDGTGYRVFDEVGQVYRSIHWRHADHWMVDIAPDAADASHPDSTSGGAMLRPGRTFQFEDGRLVIETTVASALPGYETSGFGSAWPEVDITTRPAPDAPRPNALYGYDHFAGHYTFGCRYQPDTNIICSLFEDNGAGIEGGRLWEMSFFQHVGTEVFGGNDFVSNGGVHKECVSGQADAECQMTFRLELTETSVTVFVDGMLYFEQKGIPPLPKELLHGDLYVYASSMLASHDGDTVRYHWDRFAVNPESAPGPSPQPTTTIEAPTTTTPDATTSTTETTAPTTAPTTPPTTRPTTPSTVPPGPAPSPGTDDIVIEIDRPGRAIDDRLFGTNAPAWLNPSRLTDPTFIDRTRELGTELIRLPGGSWSNHYDWLACERNGRGIDGGAVCHWPWAARPSDFADFLQATGADGVWTVNMNGTAEEAAALVAFFNGRIGDTTRIGVDPQGRDWGTVDRWARLRAEGGNPNPIGIELWEIGNEIYGGRNAKDCTPYGWEEVWSCDGGDYVNGMGSGADRRQGFLEYRTKMKAVDPSIKVGAVGVASAGEWGDWGNEVLRAAGDRIDFYVVHHYGFFEPPANLASMLTEPHDSWPRMMTDLDRAFGSRDIPIAVTEYNLVSFENNDTGDAMSRAVNALYLADTIGQMADTGVAIANQWDLSHGEGDTLPGYGLMQTTKLTRSPQYYALAMWASIGSDPGTELVPVSSPYDARSEVALYATVGGEGDVALLAINKTGRAISTDVAVDGRTVRTATVDSARATSLGATEMTYNGRRSGPSDTPGESATVRGGRAEVTLAPWSVSVIRLD